MASIKRFVPVVMIAALAISMSIAFAGHVVGNLATYQLTPVANPVIWLAGGNNGSVDIDGSTIAVTISPNGTEATVNAVITYGENQYIDILRINVTSAPYNVYVYIDPATIDPSIDLTKSKLVITDSAGEEVYSATLNHIIVTNGGLTDQISISSDGWYSVTLILYMSDGSPLPEQPITLNMKLYYSKSSETPMV